MVTDDFSGGTKKQPTSALRVFIQRFGLPLVPELTASTQERLAKWRRPIITV